MEKAEKQVIQNISKQLQVEPSSLKSEIIILNHFRHDPKKWSNTSKNSFAIADKDLGVSDCFVGSSLKGLREAS